MRRVGNIYGIAFLALGLLFLGLSIYSFVSTQSFIGSSVEVRAEVLGIESHGLRSYPQLSFMDYEGVRHNISSVPNSIFTPLKFGENVFLYARAPDWENVRVKSFFFLWGPALVNLCIGFFLLLIGTSISLGLFSRVRLPGRSRAAEPSAGSGYEYVGATSSAIPIREPQEAGAASEELSFAQLLQQQAATKKTKSEVLSSDSRLFGPLQPLVDDTEVSDIMVSDYKTVSVIRSGRSEAAKVRFESDEAFYTTVDALLRAAEVSYSTAKPIVDGMIGSEIRVHAVNPVLCETGPYLTVRINRYRTIDYAELCRFGIGPVPVMEYLRALVQIGKTTLIAGAVGSGKTTLLRALASSIPADEAILVIEDTPEIRIDHPHARYIRTRDANVAGVGKISMAECVRAGMRMAMSRIILGEIRDPDAAESYLDVCVSGHPGLSTIHGRSASDALNRLELFLGRQQRGVTREVLRDEIATAVQAVVYVRMCPRTNVRRIMEVWEIEPSAGEGLHRRKIFEYGIYDEHPGWKLVSPNSYFEDELHELTGGSPLNGLPPVFGLTQ